MVRSRDEVAIDIPEDTEERKARLQGWIRSGFGRQFGEENLSDEVISIFSKDEWIGDDLDKLRSFLTNRSKTRDFSTQTEPSTDEKRKGWCAEIFGIISGSIGGGLTSFPFKIIVPSVVVLHLATMGATAVATPVVLGGAALFWYCASEKKIDGVGQRASKAQFYGREVGEWIGEKVGDGLGFIASKVTSRIKSRFGSNRGEVRAEEQLYSSQDIQNFIEELKGLGENIGQREEHSILEGVRRPQGLEQRGDLRMRAGEGDGRRSSVRF